VISDVSVAPPQHQLRAPSLAVVVIYLKNTLEQLTKVESQMEKISGTSPPEEWISSSMKSNIHTNLTKEPQNVEKTTHAVIAFDTPVYYLSFVFSFAFYSSSNCFYSLIDFDYD
jgi:hypothetical protein